MTVSEVYEKGIRKGIQLSTDEWFKILMNDFHIPAEACDCIMAIVKYKLEAGNDVRRAISDFIMK